MEIQRESCQQGQGVRRRDVLKAGLAAGVTLSAWPLVLAPPRCGGQRQDSPNAVAHCACAAMTRCTLTRIRRLASRRTLR